MRFYNWIKIIHLSDSFHTKILHNNMELHDGFLFEKFDALKTCWVFNNNGTQLNVSIKLCLALFFSRILSPLLPSFLSFSFSLFLLCFYPYLFFFLLIKVCKQLKKNFVCHSLTPFAALQTLISLLIRVIIKVFLAIFVLKLRMHTRCSSSFCRYYLS